MYDPENSGLQIHGQVEFSAGAYYSGTFSKSFQNVVKTVSPNISGTMLNTCLPSQDGYHIM